MKMYKLDLLTDFRSGLFELKQTQTRLFDVIHVCLLFAVAAVAGHTMSGPGTDVSGELADYLEVKGINALFLQLVENILVCCVLV